MLLRLFRSNQPGVLVGLLVLVPLLFLRHLPTPVPGGGTVMPFQQLLQGLFAQAVWIHGAVLLLTLLILSIQLTGLMNEAELVDRRNHLPALLFPVLLATLAPPGSLGPAFLGMPFVLWAMRRCWSITSGNLALGALFDAGVLLGLASLFYMPYAFLIVVVWASVSVIRPFQWREYLIPLLGLLVIFYLAWGFLHLAGVTHWQPLRTIAHPVPYATGGGTVYGGLLAALLLAMLAVSLYQFASHYQRGVVREQNLRSAFLAFSATLGIIIGAVLLLNRWFPPVLLAVPLALLFTFALLGTRRSWLSASAVFALLALAFWNQFG